MASAMAKPALDVGLVTADAERLIAFYVNVFGLELLEPLVIPNIGTIHKIAVGESVLRVMVPSSEPLGADEVAWDGRSGIRYMTFEVEDVAAAVASVREFGGSVALEPFELRPGRFVSQVADPDGNMLEVGQG